MQNNFGYNFDSPPPPPTPRGWTKDRGKQKDWTQLALDKVILSTERSDVQECPPALTLFFLGFTLLLFHPLLSSSGCNSLQKWGIKDAQSVA